MTLAEGQRIDFFEGACKPMPTVQYKPDLARPPLPDRLRLRRDHARRSPSALLAPPLAKSGGRNNHGRITARHRGGGHKRRYRIIDFRRDKDGVPATVAAIEYDPNRSARLALLHYADGEKRYILAPVGLRRRRHGRWPGRGADIKPGNACRCANIPLGTMVHNVELRAGHAAASWRAAPARRSS